MQAFSFKNDFLSYVVSYDKRPLDSYACPAQIIDKGQINKYFYMQKNIQNWCNYMGKRTVCVQSLTFLAQKALFSIQFFGDKMMDYKAVSSIIFATGMCTYMCKRFHQILASGFCIHPGQPNGVKLGIRSHADYIYSIAEGFRRFFGKIQQMELFNLAPLYLRSSEVQGC